MGENTTQGLRKPHGPNGNLQDRGLGLFLLLCEIQNKFSSLMYLDLLHCRQSLYPLNHQGNPSEELASLVAQWYRIQLPMQETQGTRVRSLGGEEALEWAWQSTPGFLPGEPHGQRRLEGYSPWVTKTLTRLSHWTTTNRTASWEGVSGKI